MRSPGFAVVSASMKFDGMHEDSILIHRMLARAGVEASFYQCIDRNQKAQFSSFGSPIMGSPVFPSLLETAYNRFFTFPREIGRLHERTVIVGEQTLLNTVDKRGGIVVRVHDVLRLGRLRRDLPSTLSAKAATVIWHNSLARKLVRAEKILVPTEFVKHEVISLGARPSTVSVVYNTLPESIDISSSGRLAFRNEGVVRLLYIAADRPHKNISFYVDIADRLNRMQPGRFEFHLLSKLNDGTLSYLESKRLPNFHVHYGIGDVASLYAECDILVHPSMYEGFGRPVIEAMAHGLGVVASNIGAVSEIAGGKAILCPLGDIDSWTEAVLKMSEPTTFESFSAGSVLNARRFTMDSVSSQLMESLTEYLG